jgi:poly-gamma-glutamate synthesis protein (capsule biosynthesis protein)
MLGRGIDQLMPQSVSPELYEPYVKDARDYLRLVAQDAGAKVHRYRSTEEVWGDARDEVARRSPDLSIVNLETSATAAAHPDPSKGIHYRMHPGNLSALTALPAHCAVLANNHTLDWGTSGLVDTLQAVEGYGMAPVGAGRSAAEARRPARLMMPDGGHALVAACAHESSGVPEAWAATAEGAGVWVAPKLNEEAVAAVAEALSGASGGNELRVCSIHWGGNWGYTVPPQQQRFAHALVDQAGVDIVFGHSSHHPKGIEVYKERLILYGCGDFINDYEGIPGHEEYRPELVCGYFATVDDAGELEALELVPFVIRGFRLRRAGPRSAAWLEQTLTTESARFGTSLQRTEGNTLELRRK